VEQPLHSALRIIGWTLGLAALSVLALSAVYAPMVVSCTQTAEGWLAEAPASLKSPPAALREAMSVELKNSHPANLVTRHLILHSGCSGWTPEDGHSHQIDELVMMLPLRVSFSRDELLAMMMSRVHMGINDGESVHGFDNAARAFYGREITDLKGPEFACLARKMRAPGSRKYRCNGH
jgi:hypothetical protein